MSVFIKHPILSSIANFVIHIYLFGFICIKLCKLDSLMIYLTGVPIIISMFLFYLLIHFANAAFSDTDPLAMLENEKQDLMSKLGRARALRPFGKFLSLRAVQLVYFLSAYRKRQEYSGSTLQLTKQWFHKNFIPKERRPPNSINIQCAVLLGVCVLVLEVELYLLIFV